MKPIPVREIGIYHFLDSGFVSIWADARTDTEEALEMVEVIIRLKREELERNRAKSADT